MAGFSITWTCTRTCGSLGSELLKYSSFRETKTRSSVPAEWSTVFYMDRDSVFNSQWFLWGQPHPWSPRIEVFHEFLSLISDSAAVLGVEKFPLLDGWISENLAVHLSIGVCGNSASCPVDTPMTADPSILLRFTLWLNHAQRWLLFYNFIIVLGILSQGPFGGDLLWKAWEWVLLGNLCFPRWYWVTLSTLSTKLI